MKNELLPKEEEFIEVEPMERVSPRGRGELCKYHKCSYKVSKMFAYLC